jgi:hypothetical protein
MKKLLAASFVVTVSAGACRHQADGPGAMVFKRDTECLYAVHDDCPDGAMCNPPPPREIECPTELDPAAQPKGPVRAGWVRVKEDISCSADKCWFRSDYFCPYPGKTLGVCDESKSQEFVGVPFEPGKGPPGGEEHGTWVNAFIAPRADGSCGMYPGFWCNPNGCVLPEPTLVSCSDPPPLPSPPGTG